MPAAPLALIFAAFAAPAASPAPASAEAPLAARSDGTWLVAEAIHEEPVPLASATGGVLIDEEEWREARDADAVAEAEAERAAQRAFEEAVDAARREPRP